MSDVTITWLGGVKELAPVTYRITEREVEVRRWYPPWRSTKTEYYLEGEFGSLGPFDSAGEIRRHAAVAGMTIV